MSAFVALRNDVASHAARSDKLEQELSLATKFVDWFAERGDAYEHNLRAVIQILKKNISSIFFCVKSRQRYIDLVYMLFLFPLFPLFCVVCCLFRLTRTIATPFLVLIMLTPDAPLCLFEGGHPTRRVGVARKAKATFRWPNPVYTP